MKAIPNQPDARVTDYLSQNLNDTVYQLSEQIRQWLIETPGVSEAIKYKVPFYDYLGPLIYFNPKRDHLIIGFTKGIYMEDPFNMLVGDQKNIRHYIVNEGIDIFEHLPFYFDEAIRINKLLKKR
ncbi:DUF1801 domain-containing protein [Marinigracilibium pacificum]|uniref:DUF1801 domain-containing protein n=1 Tax=Marinigracilibium pacificum TaxID=2729599 RepID=A0A848J256_9BACT|nr:DUF1801 domain-containing protein [Marinigracilibium pacificum]NMM49585.1 DUF1801 domain-containing protein [Marinigracilibium pacificum]